MKRTTILKVINTESAPVTVTPGRGLKSNPESLELIEFQSKLAYQSSPEQYLLDSILEPFRGVIETGDFKEKRRLIKDLFLKRDFTSIFTNPELLKTYCIEYIGGRALAYRQVFVTLSALRDLVTKGCKVMALGSGNGAELVGLASAMHGLNSKVSLTVHDLSNYNVVGPLHTSLRKVFGLDDRLTINEIFGDLTDALQFPDVSKCDLVTCCFLLNEIISASKPAFARLIANLVKTMKKNSLLLVIDPASSFSECNVGTGAHKLFTLLDAISAFECIETYNECWYRTGDSLTFPIKLQNMRYFLRLYRKK